MSILRHELTMATPPVARHDGGISRSSRVLIMGAGRAGEALVRELRRTGVYQPVAFLDDAGRLHGSKLQGVPVLGGLEDAAAVARETAARMLVIAMPAAMGWKKGEQ